jgi:phosphohistidine swiveling domain-containing protein
MSSYVRPFNEIKDADTQLVGGKAANLAKLVHANLPVPNGIAVGLTAFNSDGNLNDDAKQLIAEFLVEGKLYAVRSSALAEDAEGASWAGQFETFLDTTTEEVLVKIEECHSSTKSRAKAYAAEKFSNETFDIAVVVQEMLKPEYAGVLFTLDPLTGQDTLVTEYVEGLGEELVSGRADPIRIVLTSDTLAPFDTSQLAELAKKVEDLFGIPQDIEWVWADNKIWLVQARPITITQEKRSGYYLGEPNDLFYWGPSAAKPMYMSDFQAAAERLYLSMAADPNLPNPPKTVVLFEDHKMVWLNNAQDFADFTERTFEAYEKQDRLNEDVTKWKAAAAQLQHASDDDLAKQLVDAWFYTEFAEFSLYGAEASLSKKLSRFDNQTRQAIWGAFTVPDKPTFLSLIDNELARSQDPDEMAKNYPWIKDGYDGLSTNAKQYFEERLKVIGTETHEHQQYEERRKELIEIHGLTDAEISSLTLARRIAEFMDDRKAWMMQTRHLIVRSVGNIEHGWYFNEGASSEIGEEDTHELWQRYVDFKASSSAVIGVVASNGGKHFINGEVVIVTSPTDVVADNKIVVVPSTSPSYVPLMRKAKALVTDHGGMMSHAAIVAREFNLPCIVGTKQATKVLHNGDKVVLDLVRGEVSK